MLTNKQLMTTIELQNAMNSKVDANWLEQQFPFCRAIVVEATEAIEHHGWKWWKAQDKDLAQLQMELVDIWHFMLSAFLQDNQGDQAATAKVILSQAEQASLSIDGQRFELEKMDCLQLLELMIALAALRRLNISVFAQLLARCDMSWPDLYMQYIGKNVLNFFRQDHGYKSGEYIKIWQGKEDNEVLADILASVDVNADNVQEQIYQALSQLYPA